MELRKVAEAFGEVPLSAHSISVRLEVPLNSMDSIEFNGSILPIIIDLQLFSYPEPPGALKVHLICGPDPSVDAFGTTSWR